jgi:hypothetical protein
MATWKKNSLLTLLAIGVAAGIPATSQAGNLIQNGGFESVTSVVPHLTTGQLDNKVIANHWFSFGPGTGTHGHSTDSGSFNFLYNPATATTTGAPSQSGNVALWYATPSPDGGNFVGGDGDVKPGPLHVGSISQEVDGLKPGGIYKLGFFWAAAQQKNFFFETKQNWIVSATPVGSLIPDATVSTPVFTLHGAVVGVDQAHQLPSNVFSGWMHFEFTFTASSDKEEISFLPVGNKPVPPVTLLDGVTLVSVPEPSNILASVLLFSMFGAVWMFRRAKQPAVAV